MFNDSGKLYIVITDQPEINSTTTTTTITKTTEEKKKQVKKAAKSEETQNYTFITHQFYDFIKQTATEMVNWSISNIGNFSGDYIKQANMQKAISLGSKISGIGMSVVSGFSMGGPMGALLAGTITAAGVGINLVLQDTALAFQTKKQNREINQLKELSGLNPLTNGGRI